MSMMEKIWDRQGKREWREMENRRKQLPAMYDKAFKEMRSYMWTTGVVSKWADSKLIFEELLDILENAAADQRTLTEITGADVAKFCDELAFKSSDWKDRYRKRLNERIMAFEKEEREKW